MGSKGTSTAPSKETANQNEAKTKRLRKYEPDEHMEIYKETTFGGGLEWDDRLYLGEPEQSSWDGKLIPISLEEQELRELVEMNETMNR